MTASIKFIYDSKNKTKTKNSNVLNNWLSLTFELLIKESDKTSLFVCMLYALLSWTLNQYIHVLQFQQDFIPQAKLEEAFIFIKIFL